MSRYIDKDKLVNSLKEDCAALVKERWFDDYVQGYSSAIDDIIAEPEADVQEVRHGHWIYCGHHDFHGHVFECSVCGRYLFANSKEDVYLEYPYCHCGAKMDEEEQQ